MHALGNHIHPSHKIWQVGRWAMSKRKVLLFEENVSSPTETISLRECSLRLVDPDTFVYLFMCSASQSDCTGKFEMFNAAHPAKARMNRRSSSVPGGLMKYLNALEEGRRNEEELRKEYHCMPFLSFPFLSFPFSKTPTTPASDQHDFRLQGSQVDPAKRLRSRGRCCSDVRHRAPRQLLPSPSRQTRHAWATSPQRRRGFFCREKKSG